MSYIGNQSVSYFKLISIGVVSTLLLIGCNKPQNSDETETPTQDVDTTIQVQEQPTVDIIDCDDSLATVNLTQSIRSSIAQNVHTQMREFASRSNTPFDQSQVDMVLNSILVDIANPKALHNASEDGMQTCQANLSFTLPTEDIHRANGIYVRLNEGTLQQRVQAQNLSLNNNMIVDNTFTYVVGNQAGQTVAKIAGQPQVILSIADLMAKSQLKVAVDEQRRAMNAAAEERKARLEEQARREQQQRRFEQTNPTSSSGDEDSAISNGSLNNEEQMDTPSVDSNGELLGQSNVSNSRQIVDPDAPVNNDLQSSASTNDPSDSDTAVKDTPEFSVPTDESIEVMIIEEEGTY